MEATRAALLAAAAFAAGVVNSVAGGGTLISFPAAIAAGLSPLVANATNAVALTPSALAAAWAYRRELHQEVARLRLLLLPAMLGGLAGAGLLLVTPERIFAASVPVLILVATVLLIAQNRRAPPAAPVADGAPEGAASSAARARAALLMFLVSIYGGYFGAGMGILTLALLGLLGASDMHRMNAAKTLLGVAINGAAAIGFLVAGAVDPVATIFMTAGGVAGGFAGAAVARRVDPARVRWVVVVIGLALTAAMAWKTWG